MNPAAPRSAAVDDEDAVRRQGDQPFDFRPLAQQPAIAVQADHGANTGSQLHPIERLGKKVVGAGLNAFDARFPIVERSDHDDRYFGEWRALPQPATDLEPVHLGHHDVE